MPTQNTNGSARLYEGPPSTPPKSSAPAWVRWAVGLGVSLLLAAGSFGWTELKDTRASVEAVREESRSDVNTLRHKLDRIVEDVSYIRGKLERR